MHSATSTLLRCSTWGSIKALATYLGHHNPGFALRMFYTHLMPASEERTRHAIDALFIAMGGLTAQRRPKQR
jgi:hypothetical protein